MRIPFVPNLFADCQEQLSMVYYTHYTPEEDVSMHYDELDALIARNKSAFIVPESYYDGPEDVPPAERPVPDGFLDNHRSPEEHIIIARDGDEILGFMSFGCSYTRDDLPLDDPCVYISLTIVDESRRNEGIGTGFNKILLQKVLPDSLTDEDIILRKTWNTNTTQIHTYKKFGFEEYDRDPDHRGPGIDSVWFARPTADIC